MADFYTILRAAVGESVGYDREARELLYRRAREALTAQLDSLEKPLSEEQKAEQMAQLDEAAERVEAEFAAAEAAPAEAMDGPAEGMTGEAAGAEPQADASVIDAPSPQGAAAPAAEISSEDALREETPAGQTTLNREGEGAPARSRTTRRIAAPRRERKAGSGRWALIVLLLVILGGGGLAAWRWQDIAPAMERAAGTIQVMLGAKEEVAGPEGARDEETPESGEETAGGAEPAAPAPAEETAGQQQQGEDLKGEASPQAGNGDLAPDSADEESADREVLAEKIIESVPGLQKDQDRVAPTAPAAERAFMIVEQGATGSDDLRFAGSAQWRVDGSGADTTVTVTIQIPEHSALIGFTMRHNNDESLPASHMIDISYQGGEKADGPIINVPGFMVRVPESETPVPVRSAGALIMPGQYLLGLSGSEEDRAHNLSLLSNAQWFEVPAMFESRRRLVLVIEVGESGTLALNAALAAWRGGDGGAGEARGEAAQ